MSPRPLTTCRRPAGIVLLEVLFALALLSAGVAVILSGLGGSAREATRMRTAADGADLAVSVLSQVQAGMIEIRTDGPFPAEEPHLDWTWELLVEDVLLGSEYDPAMLQVEVVVRHEPSGYTHRLVQLMAPPSQETLEEGL
jgi:hypothetical protein